MNIKILLNKQKINKKKIDSFYSSQIIFKPNCEFIIDKINV